MWQLLVVFMKSSLDILSRNIDEVYCSANELEENQLNLLIEFCENNFKILKFISKRGGLLSKKLKTDTYGLSTVQSLRQMPLSNDYNTLVKRFFDQIRKSVFCYYN